MIRRNTPPIPIGLTPGDLSKGNNQYATYPPMISASINSSEYNFRANNAIV